jgi:EAL and modified HD-GYP domain-containing signal transduction protein
MDILIVPVPLFNKDMAVEAYLLSYQRGNDYLGTVNAASFLDGGGSSPALETIRSVGIDAFTVDQPVIIPVSGIMLLSGLGTQCAHSPERVIFLFGNDLKPEEPFLSRLQALKKQGFRIAFQGIGQYERYIPLLMLGDFIILDTEKLSEQELSARMKLLRANYRNLTVIASGVASHDTFAALQKRGFTLYEGAFYRKPLTRGVSEVDPLHANLIRLLNIVRDENFEFGVVSDTVQRDPALSVSLLRLVNSPYIGARQQIKTIGHAVTLLGQNEVRKWVTTSVAKQLGSDKPNEITKLSLTRAKFCENLAPLFKRAQDSEGIFLMGLFSVLDVILELPIEQAFEKVSVSDEIRDALVNRTGRYYPVFDFVERYEAADWLTISHEIILHDYSVEDIYNAYIEAISWYSDLVMDEKTPASEDAGEE